MYVVAYFNAPGHIPRGVYPHVFPDFELAIDCVKMQIHHEYGVKPEEVEMEETAGGQHYHTHGKTTYVVGKLFNFNPRIQT